MTDKEEIFIENKYNSLPVYINIILHKYNYIDNLIISQLKKYSTANTFSIRNSDNIYITTPEFKRILNNRFLKEIKKTRNIASDQLEKNATSLYFLDSIFSTFHNIKAFNISISYDRNYTRLVQYKDVNQIYFSYKVEYGIVDVAKFLKLEEMKYLNSFYKQCEIITNDEEFVIMKASEFIDKVSLWEEQNPDAADEYYYILDVIYDSITDKVESDDPNLLIKNDLVITP